LGTLEEAREAAEDSYCGCYISLADYVQELTKESTEIPSNLAYYIDFERMARDMEMSGDIFAIAAGCHEIHVFWSNYRTQHPILCTKINPISTN
jgi:antirestriction protein